MRNAFKIILTVLLIGVITMSTACGKKEEAAVTSNPENPVATIEMQDGQIITIELMPQYAPNTVNNFIALANSGYYDDLVFHRIIKGFVIQGGDPTGTGMGGPGYSIPGEFSENGFADNTLEHTEGVISMARSGHPDSAGSQFFICDGDCRASLDGAYAGFGKVIGGMDAVHKIASGKSSGGQEGAALEPQAMKKVTVDTKGKDYPKPETIAG